MAKPHAEEVRVRPVSCPYLETRQAYEGDEGDAELHAEKVYERSVRFILTLRLGSLTKATQAPCLGGP